MPSKVAARTANRMLSGFETVRPEGGLESYPWMLVGTAFDYRVRMFFEPDFNLIPGRFAGWQGLVLDANAGRLVFRAAGVGNW